MPLLHTAADEDRFWSRVDTGSSPHGCWLWTAGTSNGYGQFRPNKTWPGIGAHVFAWLLHAGEIPEGMFVCHNCPGGDNRLCVNPAHLFLGTKSQNSLDMWAKGRGATGDRAGARKHPERLRRGDDHPARLRPERLARGERHGMNLHPERRSRGEANGFARLTAEQVLKIREEYRLGATQVALASRFNISQQTISLLVRRVIWAHI